MSNPPRIVRASDEQRAQLASLLEQIKSNTANGGDPEAFIASVVNDRTETELARLITQDHHVLKLKRQVRVLCNQRDPVLITGPSGTGKELLAKALHGMNPSNKFFAINCAGMPEKLIESELFGHSAGAFTGANKEHIGLLRAAHNGTVFLDEIAEAPLALQSKLLRVLQSDDNGLYTIRPVGSIDTIKVNTRILAATCKNLEDCMAAGTFREDLYGRLMTFELRMTGLSERPNDIPLILRHLGVVELSDQQDIYSNYWQSRVKRFNVRALQAFARRFKVLTATED